MQRTTPHIIFADNLLRPYSSPQQAFFRTILSTCLPVAFSDNLDGRPIDGISKLGFESTFKLSEFRRLVGENLTWAQLYNKIPSAAAEYLASHIPKASIALGFEIPPWFVSVLTANHIQFIDFRISPIRFGRDILIAIRGNTNGFDEILKNIAVSSNEIRIQAAIIKASRLLRKTSLPRQIEDAEIIFIGQTGNDASLVSPDGRILSTEDYTNQISSVASGKVVHYKPHPYVSRIVAKQERQTLSRAVGAKVRVTQENIYELLAIENTCSFLTISSGVAQEAPYFGKRVNILFKTICPLYSGQGKRGPSEYHQIYFSQFTDPGFWRALLGLDQASASSSYRDISPRDEFRHVFRSWWGFDTYYIDSDPFWGKVVTRGMRNWIRRVLRV